MLEWIKRLLRHVDAAMHTHEWYQNPPGSPSVVTAPGPLWECRTCGEVRWFGYNEHTSSEE